MAPLRIEDHVRMFHASCGGIVVGELGGTLTCAECGAVMDAFVSDYDHVSVGKPRRRLEVVPPPPKSEEGESAVLEYVKLPRS